MWPLYEHHAMEFPVVAKSTMVHSDRYFPASSISSQIRIKMNLKIEIFFNFKAFRFSDEMSSKLEFQRELLTLRESHYRR